MLSVFNENIKNTNILNIKICIYYLLESSHGYKQLVGYRIQVIQGEFQNNIIFMKTRILILRFIEVAQYIIVLTQSKNYCSFTSWMNFNAKNLNIFVTRFTPKIWFSNSHIFATWCFILWLFDFVELIFSL